MLGVRQVGAWFLEVILSYLKAAMTSHTDRILILCHHLS